MKPFDAGADVPAGPIDAAAFIDQTTVTLDITKRRQAEEQSLPKCDTS